jgi:CheY-like chemotaxis protein
MVVSKSGNATPPDSTGRRFSVCVLDDDVLTLGVLSRILTNGGFAARTTSRPEEALRIAAEGAPDAMLVDLHLDGGDDGLDFLSRLRSSGYAGPVFVLSSDETNDAAHASVCAGADGFLVKRDAGGLADRLRGLLAEAGRREKVPSTFPASARTYPYSMTIWDDLSHNVTLYSGSAGYVGYCDDDPQCRLYYYDNDSCSPPELLNTCGWIESVVRTSSSIDYSSSYYGEYKDLDSAGMWNPDVDDQHISVAGGYRYYYMHEAVDVACEAEWDYGDGFNNFVKVAEHWFYACGASHRVQTAYGITAC